MISDKALDMREELLDCTLIDMLPVDKTVRSFNKEFANNLAISLKEEGLYNPIAVRPNPEKSGRYILVQGRHRLYAWFRILKEQMIRATVLPVMDEQDAAMAAAAENIWRWEGKKAQTHQGPQDLARPLRREATRRRGQVGRRDCCGGTNQRGCRPSPGSHFRAETPPAEKLCGKSRRKSSKKARKNAAEKSFVKQVQKATGLSQSTAYDNVRLAKLFSTEELDVFINSGVPEKVMLEDCRVPSAKSSSNSSRCSLEA